MDTLSTYLIVYIVGALSGIFVTIAILRAFAGLSQRRFYSSSQIPVGTTYPMMQPVMQYEERY